MKKVVLTLCSALAAAGTYASVVINGDTVTFDVAEGAIETYDQAIPSDGSIVKVYKTGAVPFRRFT